MAYPNVLSVTETQIGTGTTTPTFDLPSTVESGDLLILFAATTDDPIDTGPGGRWQELWNNGAANQGAGACYALSADGTEGGGTAQVTCGGANTAAGQVYRIAANSWMGTISTDIDITGNTVSTVGANPDPPSVTAGWGSDDNLYIAMLQARDDDAYATAYPTNYTSGHSTSSTGGGNNGCNCSTAVREYSGTSDDPGTFTLSESERWRCSTLVVRPAALLYKLEGVTKDKDGAVLSACDCHLFKLNATEDDADWQAFDESDGSGNYSFTGLTDNDAKYYVVAWRDDTPHVMDATDHVLVPVLE